ncbi:uncharacterized protein LOC131847953 [Achroia grisella]|uniref:uncharacterized protein LOC131847953 n=1 Tax=Achroia grisella TaxID=688607 RepID=UPI0027D32B70|nr:uncharacterized protein LOC131847953 [Achroia grisella]
MLLLYHMSNQDNKYGYYGSIAYVRTPMYSYRPVRRVTEPHQPPNVTARIDGRRGNTRQAVTIQQDTAQSTTIPVTKTPEDTRPDNIQWILANTRTVKTLRNKVLVAGHEGKDGSPFCIIRANHIDALIPGKLAIKQGSACITHNSAEVQVKKFEVLCANPDDVCWLSNSDGKVPPGAVAAGYTQAGETLYIGRVNNLKSVIPGKIQPSNKCCFISVDGIEIWYKKYEVLCENIHYGIATQSNCHQTPCCEAVFCVGGYRVSKNRYRVERQNFLVFRNGTVSLSINIGAESCLQFRYTQEAMQIVPHYCFDIQQCIELIMKTKTLTNYVILVLLQDLSQHVDQYCVFVYYMQCYCCSTKNLTSCLVMAYLQPPGSPPQYRRYSARPKPSSSIYMAPGSVTCVISPTIVVFPHQVTVKSHSQQQPKETYDRFFYHKPRLHSNNFVEKDPINWVSSTIDRVHDIQDEALLAGIDEVDGSPLYIIRMYHKRDLIPGKLAISRREAYLPYGGKEVKVINFEVLCVPNSAVRWISSSRGKVPPGAIPAGQSAEEILYIGRVKHMSSITPGKVHPSHKCCYISFGGKEISYTSYEVLCSFTGIEWISSSPTSFLHLRALKVGNYCIIRAHHERELVPGSLNKIEKVAYIPYGGRAVPVNNFEVLCAKGSDVRWLTCSAGNIPPGAIAAGRSQNGEQLYVGRAHHRNLTIPGKVHPSHKCCYIPYSGAEVPCQTYEVLCKMYA